MTRSVNRARLDAIEASARRSGIDEAVGHGSAVKARLTVMAVGMIEGGYAWQSYEPAALAVAHAELVATAEANLANDQARAAAVLNGASPVPWEQTSEQRAASIESLTRSLSGSRVLLKMLNAVGVVINEDDPNRIPTQPGAHARPLSAISAAEFVALAMTAQIDTDQTE